MTQTAWHSQPWAQHITALDQTERTAIADAARTLLAHRDCITDPLESELTVLVESLGDENPGLG